MVWGNENRKKLEGEIDMVDLGNWTHETDKNNISLRLNRKACNILASMLWYVKGLELQNELDT